MAATMRDVAERAGVSKATVSYVLNGRATAKRIPDETRDRILEAMRALGYHPNALARSLAHRRTDTIAVVMQYPDIFASWSGFTNELMRGVTDAAIECGYDVLLHTRRLKDWQGGTPDIVEAEVATLTDGRVDGALLLRDADDPLASALNQRGFPNVLIFTHEDNPTQWFVDCDNVRGAQLVVEHLMALGHRRIVHLAGSHHSRAARDRALGFLQATDNAGIQASERWVMEITDPGRDFTPLFCLLKAGEEKRPTAIFAWSDEVAIGAIHALRGQGIEVPQQVAVVGFDSTDLCDHTDPPLTSVRQPVYKMASHALGLLTDKICGREAVEMQKFFAPELTVRRSCGASSGGIISPLLPS